MADAERAKQNLEEQKVALDYIKHVTTLATSVVVFSVAFVDKLASRPYWKWLLIPGLGLQLVCLVSLSLSALGAISAGRSGIEITRPLVRFTVIGTAVGLGAFLAGIGSLAIFLVRSLV